MSGGPDVAPGWPALIDTLPKPGLVVETETVIGKMTLSEHAASAGDPFGSYAVEFDEVAESLLLNTQARVYEEIVVSVQAGERTEKVSAVLRREKAEVTVTGKVVGATPPMSGREGICQR